MIGNILTIRNSHKWENAYTRVELNWNPFSIENDSENIIITAINSYHYQYLSGYHHVHLSRSRLQEEGVSEVYSEPGLISKILAVKYFCKALHLRCFTGFWVRLVVPDVTHKYYPFQFIGTGGQEVELSIPPFLFMECGKIIVSSYRSTRL